MSIIYFYICVKFTIRKFINEVQMRTTKGRVWSIIVNEPELVASGGGAQISLQNITSRFVKSSIINQTSRARSRGSNFLNCPFLFFK